MRFFYVAVSLCFIALTAPAVAQTPPQTDAPIDNEDAAEAFMRRYGEASADSLERVLRSDYALCAGDSSRVSRDRLFRWKAQVDSLVMDREYPEKLRLFVASTGVKPHDVRPCEPLAFSERLNRQINEMDSIISAQRALRDKARDDSVTMASELSTRESGPADILNIPAGVSRWAAQLILANSNIRVSNMPDRLQVDQVRFVGLVATIAFYFDENDRYSGYEVETEALSAERLDDTVRGWTDLLTLEFTKRIGPPNTTNRVPFRDIRPGRLSVVARWDKSERLPQTLIGLATHDNLYYAKVMVSY